MKSRVLGAIVVVTVIAVVVVILSPVVQRNVDTQPIAVGSGPLIISLAPPAFAQATASSFPMNEVGICAYVNVGGAINLATARTLFSAIEDATDGYVIGTVRLTGNAEDMWPHAYISRDGWLLAYYPTSEARSKLVQWYGYQRDVITTTTLRDTLLGLGRSLGLDISRIDEGMTYFDFGYPDATRLLIVADTENAGASDEFRYTIPSGITLYAMAWSQYSAATNGAGFSIDGAAIYTGGRGTYVACYSLSGKPTDPKVRHSLVFQASQLNSAGWMGLALVFLYR